MVFNHDTLDEQISPPIKPRLYAKFFAFALFVRGYSFQLCCLGNSFTAISRKVGKSVHATIPKGTLYGDMINRLFLTL